MEARLERCLEGWDDSSATAPATSEQMSDEPVTNALHMMQDHLQQTTVISQRRSQKTLTQKSASKTKDNAAYEATEAATHVLEWQAETRRLFEQKCQDAAEPDTICSEAIKNTLEKKPKRWRNTSRP